MRSSRHVSQLPLISFCDLIAMDFFGSALVLRGGETDEVFRLTYPVQYSLRPAPHVPRFYGRWSKLTGRTPVIFEPSYTHDTGGYGTLAQGGGGMALGLSAGTDLWNCRSNAS